ncbi:MAG: IS1182 family transposase [Polyangiales bacterium]
MTLGRAPTSGEMFGTTTELCEARLSPTSVFALLHRDCHRLFPDESFADLFTDVGRRSISPRVVAVVMVLQRLEGLSDREAVERFTFDARWKYAAGGLPMTFPSFVHTVLVDMRARLRNSTRPNRIFETVLGLAKEAGLVGRRRVLDSAPLYDAVATQDTVTMIRSAICGLIRVASPELADELRAVLRRDDDYTQPGKPACEWDDKAAREALVDALTRDAHAALLHLSDMQLSAGVIEAANLLATVVGQDIEETVDGTFRIARRVAHDRVISTVDPDARHGHKTAARAFDGYKGHVAIDPDSEIVVTTTVTPANAGDGSVAEALIADLIPTTTATATATATIDETTAKPEIYGDASYGLAPLIEKIEAAGGESIVKVQAPTNARGLHTKDAFDIDLDAGTVRCPAGQLVQIRHKKDGSGVAMFTVACGECPQRASCTKSASGRVVSIHKHERTLARERKRQRDPAWKARYRATRPKVERKLAHLLFVSPRRPPSGVFVRVSPTLESNASRDRRHAPLRPRRRRPQQRRPGLPRAPSPRRRRVHNRRTHTRRIDHIHFHRSRHPDDHTPALAARCCDLPIPHRRRRRARASFAVASDHRRRPRTARPPRRRTRRRGRRRAAAALVVIGIGRSVGVHVHRAPVDMRKQFDTLAAVVEQGMRKPLLSGDVYVFIGRTKRRAKLLYWDGTGLCLLAKRLEKGHFIAPWADGKTGPMTITIAELSLLLEGCTLVGKTPLSPPPYRPGAPE